jgi:pyruvate ferredoxin oxidoreductase alpha subunit
MVGLDGFTLSHTLENVQTLLDDDVHQFIGIREILDVLTHEGKQAPFRLDPKNPMTMGPIALQNYYFEFKRQQEEAMKNALQVIKEVNNKYGDLSGRKYGNGMIESYKLEDAEIAAICLGSTAGTMKTVVDDLRILGIKAGLLRIRTFRPFPVDDIKSALENIKAVAVMDKSISFGGNGGPAYHEVRHVLYDSDSKPFVVNYIYGLGGRDTSPAQLKTIYHDLQEVVKNQTIKESIKYLGLRE